MIASMYYSMQIKGNNENRVHVGNQTFIEINGKKYDAVTGRLITNESPTPAVKTVVQAPAKQHSGVVDGFVRRPSKPHTAHHTAPTAVKKPQKSQTLARAAVKKPKPTIAPAPKQEQFIKPSLKAPAHRVARAHTIQKSPQIRKFDTNEAPRTSVVKKQTSLAVVQPKVHQLQEARSRSDSAVQKQASHPSASAKILEAALHQAQAHEETYSSQSKRKRSLTRRLGISPKMASVSAAVLAAVLLGGFFAIQNVPNLSMRVASTRAGFDARMPGYQPAGFSFKGPINYTSGQVKVSFRATTDNREYTVSQTSSNWNSDALLANFITNEKKQYQTYLDKGRTLYIYDGSNATWVDDGVWYQIEGNSSLTTDQLIRIASSL